MNITFAKQVSLLLGLTALSVVSGGLSVQAQITSTAVGRTTTPLSVQGSDNTNQTKLDPAMNSAVGQTNPNSGFGIQATQDLNKPILSNWVDAQNRPQLPQLNVFPTEQTPQTPNPAPTQLLPTNTAPTVQPQPSTPMPQLNVLPADIEPEVQSQPNPTRQLNGLPTEESQTAESREITQPQLNTVPSDVSAETAVTPETFSQPATSSAAALKTASANLEYLDASPENSEIAQADIEPGRPNRSGRSYVGVGFNIGITGEQSGLGDGNIEIISKIGLTNVLSLRPSVILGGETAFLIPVTYDFNIRQVDPFEPVRFAPYVGGGVIFTTGDNSSVGFLLSGGVDLPLSRAFTANAGINIGFLEEDTDVGIRFGVGYNFGGF